jgi:transcriptional regulator with XRE-family HTH domain
MESLAERLRAAVAARGVSLQSLEGDGVPRGYPSLVASGKRKRVGPDVLGALARKLRVSYEWLATGNGDMGEGDSDAAPTPTAVPRHVPHPRVVEIAKASGIPDDVVRSMLAFDRGIDAMSDRDILMTLRQLQAIGSTMPAADATAEVDALEELPRAKRK